MNKTGWTLFLDRDGVINEKIPDNYVKNFNDFIFCGGFLDVFSRIVLKFDYIFIVTNQQGIGKKLMSVKDLEVIHDKMLYSINNAGGRIDKIYFCPHLKDANCICRKPKPGMAYMAKKDFPGIDFCKSILVGDSIIDMEFGKNFGAKTILINNNANFDNADYKIINFYELEILIDSLIGL
jgi:histidinol-phosphate phosphatase family protein